MKATLLGCLALAVGLGVGLPAAADDMGDDTGIEGPGLRRSAPPAPTPAAAPAPPAAEPPPPPAAPAPAPAAAKAPEVAHVAAPAENGFLVPTLEGDWRFRVMIDAFIPTDIEIGHDGPLGSGSTTLHLNTFLLPALTNYVPIDVDVRKGSFGVFVHTLVLGLDGRSSVGPHSLDWDTNAFLMDTGISYQLGRWKLGDGPRAPTLTVEPYLAARLLYVPIDIRIAGRDGTINGFTNYVPIIGMRTFWDLTEHWNLEIGGDYGGFGVDNNDGTWLAYGLIGYRWGGWGVHWNFQIGYKAYRWVDMTFGDTQLTLDPRGPNVGIAVEF